ncbi:protein phosphatase 2C domain-containing protein [Desulfococcaceae bacterium HSG7]|nr:protein phosphatase 2C domain-containing protein [Desulfococcaceae bacterium HSG7]
MSGKSDVGRKRKNNEDRFLIRPDLGFCLLVDGMGGEAAGEIASAIFTQTALELFSFQKKWMPFPLQTAIVWLKERQKVKKWDESPSESITFKDAQAVIQRSESHACKLVKAVFSQANKRILQHVKKYPERAGMGCTAELIVFYKEGYLLGHVGDSRVYLYNEQLMQLTIDHTLLQESIDKGLTASSREKERLGKNVLIKAVGVEQRIIPDIEQGKIKTGDMFLLCSDGLTDKVDDTMLKKIVSKPLCLSKKSDVLISEANNAGGHDNITVILIEVL